MKRIHLLPVLAIVSAALTVALCAFTVFQNMQLTQARGEVASAASELARANSSQNGLHSRYDELHQKVSSLQSEIAVRQALISSSASGYKVSGDVGPKVAYLTFDDGPSKYTPQLLQALKTAGVKATFFVIGKNCESHPDALKAIAADGHVVGVHSWTHDMPYIYSDINNFKQDYQKLDDYLTQQLGHKPDICRFPGGTNNTKSLSVHGGVAIMPQVLETAVSMGLRPIDWDADARDAEEHIPTKDEVVHNVMHDIGHNHHPIVLMHDFGNRTSTIDAVPEIVAQLKAQGYTFDTLSANVDTAIIFKPAPSRVKK